MVDIITVVKLYYVIIVTYYKRNSYILFYSLFNKTQVQHIITCIHHKITLMSPQQNLKLEGRKLSYNKSYHL